MQRRSVSTSVLSVALALICAALPATATAENSAQETQLATVMQRLIENPQSPQQFSADVQLHVRLRVFPWISLTFHGNEFYKHPGLYHLVLRGAPKSASQFSDVAYELGDAGSWSKKYDISLPVATAQGTRPVLRLVPKTRGMTKTLDVTVDPERGRIDKAVWSRYDGGVITITQRYDALGEHQIVAEQNASIRLPHMSADVVATYSNFETQEAVSSHS